MVTPCISNIMPILPLMYLKDTNKFTVAIVRLKPIQILVKTISQVANFYKVLPRIKKLSFFAF